MRKRWWTALGAAVATALVGAVIARSVQTPAVRPVDESVLREYVGAYRWATGDFLYLELWNELSAKNQLVMFDESGEVRALYPTDPDRFFAGPGAGVSTAVESELAFRRDAAGRVSAIEWRPRSAAPRAAERVNTETREDVRFSNGAIQLAGTLIKPNTKGRLPAVILVHASGAADRGQVLPFARFLVRQGMAVLGYDKRGVGGSTGDWNVASFEDLAGDAVAAFAYLKSRPDIDPARIGLLGWSQAGWVMPLAAVRAKDIAFVISLSGAGVPVAETTIDQTRNELAARGLPPPVVERVVGMLELQYEFARTGKGWGEYAAARAALAARMGPPPATFPGTQDDPYWQFLRRLYFYDPAPTLRQLQTPTLALFGELDNNIMAEKNRAAWEAAFKAGVNKDYTLTILSRANHALLEAKIGSNAEMPSLTRFVPEYLPTVRDWLATRITSVKEP